MVKMIVDTRKLSLMKERPRSTVLYLPTEFVKKAGFSPDQIVQVIFGDNEIKIVKDIKSVEI
jgi:hypothetical protein